MDLQEVISMWVANNVEYQKWAKGMGDFDELQRL